MDSKKTGLLIAQKRGALNMTQKQLADQLHISDRTVSRWERGVGFPDLSLMEPLANALGLSVVELLRGEEIPQEERLAPASEQTVRESVTAWGCQMKRIRKLLRVLLTVLVVAVCVIFVLWLNPNRAYYADAQNVSAAKALKENPFALITVEEHDLMRQLWEEEEIQTARAETEERSEALNFVVISGETLARYAGRFQIDDNAAQLVEISVIGGNLYVLYQNEDYQCALQMLPNGTLYKLACRYEGNRAKSPAVENWDNTRFQITRVYRDLLAPVLDDQR